MSYMGYFLLCDELLRAHSRGPYLRPSSLACRRQVALHHHACRIFAQAGCRIGFRVWGSGFRAWGSGFRGFRS